MLSPGSTTRPSRVCSSPKIEQLQASMPTGRISWIICRLYTQAMAEALNVLMRWLHISSVAALIGGMIYGRVVMTSSAGELAPEPHKAVDERAAALFRPIVI